MYSCVVMSILTAKAEIQKIDNLGDLVSKFPDKRIVVIKGNFAHDVLKNSPHFNHLLPRIDAIEEDDFYDDEVLWYQKVHEGSHVYVDFAYSIKETYESYLTSDFKCQYPLSNLRFSSTTLAHVQVSWIYRKYFALKNFIDIVRSS